MIALHFNLYAQRSTFSLVMLSKIRVLFICVFLAICSTRDLLCEKEFRNAVLFLADDGGFELGAYGNKVIKTPNIDKLAENGILFQNAFSSVSSCSPSRSAIYSGQAQHENGMYGLHHKEHHFQSFDRIVTLPLTLRKHGIETGLIGKKHVGPKEVYSFDFERSEAQRLSVLQVGRNITFMKLMVRQFLAQSLEKRFFLVIAFHDPHRCGHSHPEYGEFCEKFGNKNLEKSKFGVIPDWDPVSYSPNDVQVPEFVSNSITSRSEIAAQYTTISRMDQGIGLVLKELADFGKLNNSLLIYTSDNGIPFPNGRTNLYDSGIRQPLIISIGGNWEQRKEKREGKAKCAGERGVGGTVVSELVTHLDIAPTIQDWFNIGNAKKSNAANENASGKSLLPFFGKSSKEYSGHNEIFASHSLHEITMYYPMRAIRTKNYKLIHNLNYGSPYPIDQDLFVSKTFQDLLNKTTNGKDTNWFKNLTSYYFRAEWELFDLNRDRNEQFNLATSSNYSQIIRKLKSKLYKWQSITHDPWLCSPHAVLLRNGQCSDLHNAL